MGWHRAFILNLIGCFIAMSISAQPYTIVVAENASPRVRYGAQRLAEAMKSSNLDATVANKTSGAGQNILLQGPSGPIPSESPDAHDSYVIRTMQPPFTITGADDSGILYGSLDLAERIRETKAIPNDLHVVESPVYRLRGPCIGMQKTYILPGRRVYEYPYTPELFPFFYDKQHWTEYLDFLAEHRMNTLYLWNGHPFSSLVRVPEYPEAVEVSEDVFKQNQEMFHWLTAEADKRGIWVVQMFYNILLPQPFAEKHGLETQLKAPHPIAADYTRKAVAQFVKEYPSVGLMFCLGEALQGIDNQRDWCVNVILPGIKDGMTLAGLKEEPPVIIRTHATDLRQIMPDALKVYKNLYTEQKYNGESLTTHEPRGRRQALHQAMASLGSTHMINVHILANLEPFRYGAQRFIQKSMQAGRDRLGAKGLHLYPLFYWDWPVSPDKTDVPLKQIDRDWIWFEAWARYAWNPDIDETSDRAYWIERLTAHYGTPEAAKHILDAYNDSGECAPRILRRYGITEGNRQTMALGMTLDQLVNPDRYSPFEELWESQSPPGERLQEFVQKQWKKQPHEGETPPQINDEVLKFSQQAVDAIEAAEKSVTVNRDEFLRLKNDIHCIRAISQNYVEKVNAAVCVLRFGYSNDIKDMEQAEKHLAASLEHYRTLTNLTKDTYKFANSMQTTMRRVPVLGQIDGKPANYHWTQLLPVYEKELSDFRAKLEKLKSQPIATVDESTIKPLPAAAVTVLGTLETFDIQVGAKIFTDQKLTIQSLAPELVGLKGVRIAHQLARDGTPVEFETAGPVQVLIGYVKSDDPAWRKPPNLETDALAGEHGGVDPVIQNALTITDLPAINVHVMTYPAGKHKLDLRGQGSYLILGFVPSTTEISRRDAGRRAAMD